jgi:hypothetical protein
MINETFGKHLWIADTSELFNITVKSLVKTNAELSNAKRDLTTKLEGIVNWTKIGESWETDFEWLCTIYRDKTRVGKN